MELRVLETLADEDRPELVVCDAEVAVAQALRAHPRGVEAVVVVEILVRDRVMVNLSVNSRSWLGLGLGLTFSPRSSPGSHAGHEPFLRWKSSSSRVPSHTW